MSGFSSVPVSLLKTVFRGFLVEWKVRGRRRRRSAVILPPPRTKTYWILSVMLTHLDPPLSGCVKWIPTMENCVFGCETQTSTLIRPYKSQYFIYTYIDWRWRSIDIWQLLNALLLDKIEDDLKFSRSFTESWGTVFFCKRDPIWGDFSRLGVCV